MAQARPAATLPRMGGNIKNADLLEERRHELVAAATAVFFERGFDRSTVNEIADRCGWSIGALYRYVKTKDDILVLVCSEIYRNVGRDSLRVAALEADPVDAFAATFSSFCATIERNRRQIVLMYREYGRLSPRARRHFMEEERGVMARFAELVTDGVARGVFVCEDPELFAVDCVGRAHGLALKSWALGQRSRATSRASLTRWALAALGAQTDDVAR